MEPPPTHDAPPTAVHRFSSNPTKPDPPTPSTASARSSAPKTSPSNSTPSGADSLPDEKPKTRRRHDDDGSQKRRCVSTACIACRKRKSRCDGNTPSCAACATVYGTTCVYDPNSDHRRKGVYKKDADSLKTRSSTLQTLVSAILNYPADEVPDLIRQIRACDSLDKVADSISAREAGAHVDEDSEDSPIQHVDPLSFEHQLSSKTGELRIEDGSLRFIGGTSNLLYGDARGDADDTRDRAHVGQVGRDEAILSWTDATDNAEVVMHLLNMYFTWHYSFFTTLSKSLFWRDFYQGRAHVEGQRTTEYCSALLVNAMLALGCHFSLSPAAREEVGDVASAGDHFFKEAKRLISDGDLYEDAKITTVQALALMSVREAGCGRESKGWVYSGISFRMACDLGLNYESDALAGSPTGALSEEEIDCRRITFWGCFLFDKCWSNYLGRLPLFQTSNNVTVPKFDVSGHEDSETWCPYTDSGPTKAHSQPSRTRAVALQISSLCDISSDLMKYFYHPQEKSTSKQAELTRLGDCHSRLEAWRRNLPKEMEPKEGALPAVLVMHMLFQLLYIHLFRPFLKYSPHNSPLPAHVSPRKLCTNAAATISKLLRLYKRSYGLRQICNIAVYIAHSACTIHLLNLPDKNAKRDITHGVRHLEEIADGWLCARRTLCVLSLQARKWHAELPEEAATVLARSDARYGRLGGSHEPRELMHDRTMTRSDGPPADPSLELATSLPPQPHGTWASREFPHPAAPFLNADGTIYDPFLDGSATPSVASTFSSAGPSPDQSRAPNPDEQYQNLLRQQQSWQEAAQRNGIPHAVAPNMQPQRMFASAQAQRHHQAGEMPPPARNAPRAPSSSFGAAAAAAARPSSGSAPDASQLTGPPSSAPRAGMNGKIGAASNMFGGVEALLREGQDWWVEDQSQVASGFGNWRLSSPTSSATTAAGPGAGGSGRASNWSGQRGSFDAAAWDPGLGAAAAAAAAARGRGMGTGTAACGTKHDPAAAAPDAAPDAGAT